MRTGTRVRKTRGRGDSERLGGVMNKPHFGAEFVKYNVRWSEERCVICWKAFQQ